ncbi:MAG: M23 family metallopeptidase [Candidatus Altiarchaeota archaeon]
MDWCLVRSKSPIILVFFLSAAGTAQAAVCHPCCDWSNCTSYDEYQTWTGICLSGADLTVPFSMDCTNCCNVCKRGGKFVWPVAGVDLAEDRIESTCDVNQWDSPTIPCLEGHLGLDLFAEDDEIIYAAFSGTIHRFNESGIDPEYYYLGCALSLRSYNGERIAYYGHLLEKDMAPEGIYVTAGVPIGRAGGNQENPVCRGDSQGGPRLYFEMEEIDPSTGTMKYVDPLTCIPDDSNFWYTDSWGDDCRPNLHNTEDCMVTVFERDDGEPTYQAPSYSCPSNDTTSQWMYADVTINQEGNINLSCSGKDLNKTCMSEMYMYNMPRGETWPYIALQPDGDEDKSPLNCFMKFLRVWSNGNTTCGSIVGTGSGAHIEYDRPCDDDIVGIGTAKPDQSRNIAIMNIQPITGGESESLFMGNVVATNEYTIIGLDDRNYTESMKNQEDTRSIMINPIVTPFYIDYVMIRSIDYAGTIKVSENCKRGTLGMKDSLWTSDAGYARMVRSAGFVPCEYFVIDGGKFYDDPDDYIALSRFSRLSANRGEIFYSQI